MICPNIWNELLSSTNLFRATDNDIAKSFHAAATEEQCLDILEAEKSALFLVKHEGQENPTFIHSVTTTVG